MIQPLISIPIQIKEERYTMQMYSMTLRNDKRLIRKIRLRRWVHKHKSDLYILLCIGTVILSGFAKAV